MKFSFSIVVCLAAVGSASSIASTTATTMRAIMGDFSKLGQQYAKIVDDVNAFPQSGMAGVQVIHDDLTIIDTLFQNVNDNLDALPRPVSNENSRKIFSTYNSLTPNILDYLNGITDKAADFKSLDSASAIISSDLIGANGACVHFGETLMAIIPPVMTDAANIMLNGVDVARDNAIAALA
ncbi:hypothetical protein JR316_0009416 [Psilocybe cubensis]|uniref:Uncharacterized protein n=2 Tax=Psilocybe cubensis TaxID=181762 RepID=A0ACB8GT89_PSICU|nr:hypothetical protein JR316_0009416 [Psilocybe cubensis]KAH9478953.1 hypothetical protein JR316_0009416 [Psilocybe cubensis]